MYEASLNADREKEKKRMEELRREEERRGEEEEKKIFCVFVCRNQRPDVPIGPA